MEKRSIRELRAGRKMSQTELAKRLGVPTMYVAVWEQADMQLMAKIGRIFGVSATEVQMPAKYD